MTNFGNNFHQKIPFFVVFKNRPLMASILVCRQNPYLPMEVPYDFRVKVAQEDSPSKMQKIAYLCLKVGLKMTKYRRMANQKVIIQAKNHYNFQHMASEPTQNFVPIFRKYTHFLWRLYAQVAKNTKNTAFLCFDKVQVYPV